MATVTRTHEWKRPRSTYRSREDWSLRWWIVFALLLSVVFHGVLVVGFESLSGRAGPSVAADPVPQQIKINPELLRQKSAIQEIPEMIAPGVEPELDRFEPDLDDFDKAQMLPENQEIDLTPNVSEIRNFVRENVSEQVGPSGGGALDMARLLAPDNQAPGPSLAEEMAAVRRDVLSAPVSEKQMLLDANALEVGDSGESVEINLLDKVRAEGDGMGEGGGPRVAGFSNLDDLLGQGGGQLGGSTAPILMPTDLLFEYGSAELAEAARLSLMKLGFLIQKNPDSLFIVEGHTDSFGSEDFNLRLSLERARAVVGWLQQSLRLETNRVRAVGMGKNAPIVPTTGTVEEQALNRRVEIKVRPRS